MSNFTYRNEYNQGTGLFGSAGGSGSGGTPIGTIIIYASATPPQDFLLCDGSAYATSGAYSLLHDIIGDEFASDTPPPAGQFRVPNLKGKMAVMWGGSDDSAVHGEMDTGVYGHDGGTAMLQIDEIPDHHHATEGHTHSITMGAHQHYYGHLHLNPHTHDKGTMEVTGGSHDHAVGTINYTQNSHQHSVGTINYVQTTHQHEMLLHDHDMPHTHTGAAHSHTLNNPSGSTQNRVYPFYYNNTGYSGYNGFLYGTIDAESLAGVTRRYYPGQINPTEETTPAAGGASSAATTGNSNTTYTDYPTENGGTMSGDAAAETATGSMSGTTEAGGEVAATLTGDTGEQVGTEYPLEPTATSISKSLTTFATDQWTDNGYGSGTIASADAVVGEVTNTEGVHLGQNKFALPFLALSFCIRYKLT